MEFNGLLPLLFWILTLSDLSHCQEQTEVSQPPPVCPGNCLCSENFSVLRCTNSFTIRDHRFAALVKEIHLDRNFVGPIYNQTFLHLNSLTMINASNCRISYVQIGAFAGLRDLKTLLLAGNNIQLLEEALFQDTIHLEVLDLSRNKLTFLHDRPFRFLTALKVLNVSYNRLKTAKLGTSFQVMTRLEVLDFSGNMIETVIEQDLAVVEQWEGNMNRSVEFSNCGLKVIEAEAIRKFRSLTHLGLAHNVDISFNNMSDYLEAIRTVQLRSLDVSYTNISSKLNLSDFTVENLGTLSLHELMMSGNGFERIDENLLSYLSLRKLDLSHNKLNELGNGIAKLQHMKHLDLSFNHIASISALFQSRSTNLEFLNFANNSLNAASNLLLDQATNLKTLILRNNLYESYDIPRQLVNLETLDLSGNQLTAINNGEPLISMDKLKHLDLGRNKLTRIGDFMFRDSDEIYYVSFAGNEISAVSHQAFVSNGPKVIDLSQNKLEKIHIFGWIGVKEILLNDNAISEIDEQTFFSLSSLERLDLHHNLISELPDNVFSHLSNLTELDLHQNSLTDRTPLDELLINLGKLQKLDLSYNNFTRLDSDPSPFEHNFQLTDVSMSNNKIKVFHPATFDFLDKLKTLDFSRNPFECSCDNYLMQKWVKDTTVYIKNQANYGYVCRSPKMRGTATLMTYEVKMFECNQQLFFIVLFSSIGGASMLVALTLALVCFCVRRYRKGNLDIQSKEESMDLMETEKTGTTGKEGSVTPNEYLRRMRTNYLKGTRSDTLIDVEFENPNLLLDGDVVDKKVEKRPVTVERKIPMERMMPVERMVPVERMMPVGRMMSMERKMIEKKRSPLQKFSRSSLRRSLDMRKLKYYANLHDSMRHKKKRNHTKTLKDVKRKDKEKLKKLLEEMDKEMKNIEKKRQKRESGRKKKTTDKKRKPRDNKDLVRMMSMKHSKSMPDVLSYVNSLPRHRYQERDRSYRYDKVPIYHIDYSDPQSQRGWVKSMVDIPRVYRKPTDHYATYRPRHRGESRHNSYERLIEENDPRYGRIPLGYHTISFGRSPMVHSKGVERGRGDGLRYGEEGYGPDGKWIPNGHVRGTDPRNDARMNEEVANPKLNQPEPRRAGQGMSVDVEETELKTRLLVREDEQTGGTLPAGYHTIATKRGVTLAPDTNVKEGSGKYHKLDKTKSASVDGHLSQWV